MWRSRQVSEIVRLALQLPEAFSLPGCCSTVAVGHSSWVPLPATLLFGMQVTPGLLEGTGEQGGGGGDVIHDTALSMKPWAQLWGQVPSPHQKGGRQGHVVLRLFYPATFASCYRSGWVTLHCHLPCWDLGRSVPFPS